jgi:hypothetical protein
VAMEWTELQRAELAREYSRIGYVAGELWPAPRSISSQKIFSLCFAGFPMGRAAAAMLPSSQGREMKMRAPRGLNER